MPRRTLFVTTALPYANGPFHIGHIMEYIQADIWVRFQRMQGHDVHFVCADDAHGAPIMLAAEAEGVTPQQLVARIAATRPKILGIGEFAGKGFHLSFDHWHSTDSPENVELSQDIYRRLKARGLIYSKAVEQFFDPVKAMFLPDRYIKGECPVCGAKDQYGDSCEVCGSVYAPTDLKNPYSTLTGATPVLKSSEHFFFRLSDPAVRRLPAAMDAGPPAGCSPRWRTRRSNGWRKNPAATARASPTGTSRATRRTSASRSPTRRASTSTSGSTRRSAIWQASRPISPSKGDRAGRFSARRRRRAISFHRQGHRLFPHAVLAGDAEVRRRAVQGAGQHFRARLHHRSPARRCPSRAAPASAPSSISTWA